MTAGSAIDRIHQATTHRPDGCHEFTGHRQADGYGHVRHFGKMRLTHRVAWEHAFGPIPEGLCVCHRCDFPACVNPEHLFLGTHAQNMADMSKKNRASRSGSPRISDDDVVAIRSIWRSNKVSRREISLAFGISPTHVTRLTGRHMRKAA